MRKVVWIFLIMLCITFSIYFVIYRDPSFHSRDILYKESLRVKVKEVVVGRGQVLFYTNNFKLTLSIADVIYCHDDEERRFKNTRYAECLLVKDSMSADILLISPTDSVKIIMKIRSDSTLYAEDHKCP